MGSRGCLLLHDMGGGYGVIRCHSCALQVLGGPRGGGGVTRALLWLVKGRTIAEIYSAYIYIPPIDTCTNKTTSITLVMLRTYYIYMLYKVFYPIVVNDLGIELDGFIDLIEKGLFGLFICEIATLRRHRARVVALN